MSTANDAYNVVSAVGAKFAHMGNNAHNVANVVGAKSVNTANNAHFVLVAVALRIVNTCGLPARANYVKCVIYVVPWVTLSTVDVNADTTP